MWFTMPYFITDIKESIYLRRTFKSSDLSFSFPRMSSLNFSPECMHETYIIFKKILKIGNKKKICCRKSYDSRSLCMYHLSFSKGDVSYRKQAFDNKPVDDVYFQRFPCPPKQVFGTRLLTKVALKNVINEYFDFVANLDLTQRFRFVPAKTLFRAFCLANRLSIALKVPFPSKIMTAISP